MNQLLHSSLVFVLVAIAPSAHAMKAQEVPSIAKEEGALDLLHFLPKDLVEILNDDSLPPPLSLEDDPNVLASHAEKSAIVLHMPVPVRAIPEYDSDDPDAPMCPLVAHLERVAMATWIQEREALETQRDDHIHRSFLRLITEPIRTIAKSWEKTDKSNPHFFYWRLRQTIEDNLPLFFEAPRPLIKHLRNIVTKSHLPHKVKNGFLKLLHDYYHDYQSRFWDYYIYINGRVYHRDCLLEEKKRFSRKPTLLNANGMETTK